jgi:quaternary ammonium compound-resistance protein SugE
LSPVCRHVAQTTPPSTSPPPHAGPRGAYHPGMAWVYLFAAGICEIVWAAGLKAYGFTFSKGGAFTVAMMLLSFVLLDQAMKRLPLGTSYAIWTGIGAVGAAIIGIVKFNEPRDWPRLICIALIVAGIVGLKLLHREGAVGS